MDDQTFHRHLLLLWHFYVSRPFDRSNNQKGLSCNLNVSDANSNFARFPEKLPNPPALAGQSCRFFLFYCGFFAPNREAS